MSVNIEKLKQDIRLDEMRIKGLYFRFNDDMKDSSKIYRSDNELKNSVNWFVDSLNRCCKNYKRSLLLAKKEGVEILGYTSLEELNILLVQN